MAHVVVLGAGLGGTIMAYELRDRLGKEHRVSVVTNGDSFFFVPSNPWVAVGWRDREAVEVDLEPVLKARDIALHPQGAKRLDPAASRIELNDGGSLTYDYLVIATGPELAFDEIEGLGPEANTQSICLIDHALKAKTAVDALVANPGPVVIGAVQGASCFGPAYEFAFILDKALRDAKVRDRVPMTFVTSEPYIGHLGLDGVGDTKGLLESELRNHHIKWITNARVDKFEPGRSSSPRSPRTAALRRAHEVPFVYAMMLPAFRGVEAVRGIEGLTNPRGFILADKYQRNPAFPDDLLGRRLRRDPAARQDAGSGRRSQDRLHDRIDGDGHRAEHRAPDRRPAAGRAADLERRLPRRFRRQRHRLRRPAANSAAQRQLVVPGQMGSRRQDRLREVLPPQDALGPVRAVLRKPRPAGARHRQAEGGQGRAEPRR